MKVEAKLFVGSREDKVPNLNLTLPRTSILDHVLGEIQLYQIQPKPFIPSQFGSSSTPFSFYNDVVYGSNWGCYVSSLHMTKPSQEDRI
ncbi:hypothetical protein QVD17_27232 [Tagetes erecta]|uniref:Uncharacterized protein n=1 Tax=Tagetes erecta TaxID=13708 RepID=A0AAD8K8Q9_TARER|nr:hypothetical protein QVD17_27232 [Tagetes erecta]